VFDRTAATGSLAAIVLAVLACGGAPPPVAPAAPRILEFIENDWPRALAEARSRRVPIFVEAWAPW
jgi:hypothetical protein